MIAPRQKIDGSIPIMAVKNVISIKCNELK